MKVFRDGFNESPIINSIHFIVQYDDTNIVYLQYEDLVWNITFIRKGEIYSESHELLRYAVISVKKFLISYCNDKKLPCPVLVVGEEFTDSKDGHRNIITAMNYTDGWDYYCHRLTVECRRFLQPGDVFKRELA